MIVHERTEACLRPPGGMEDRAELRWHHDSVVSRPDRVVQHRRPDLGDDRRRHLLGVGGPLVHDLAGSRRREDRHRRDSGRDPAFGGERCPAVEAFLVLGDDPGDLPGMAERRPVELAGADLEQVAEHEAHGTTDADRRPVRARQDRVCRRHAELAADLAVHDDQDRAAARRCGRPVHEYLGATQRLDRGDDHGEVRWQAAGEDRIDRNLLRREGTLLHRFDTDDGVGRVARPGEHRLDARRGRRDDGQAVGPTAVAVQALGVVVIDDVEGPRGEHHGEVLAPRHVGGTACRTATRCRTMPVRRHMREREETEGARTGEQYLAHLSCSRRRLYLGNDRVDDATTHPQTQGAARSVARVFDLQHHHAADCLFPDPETG
ncbi:MAG: hypothetical protein FJW83_09410, partial [Actinobacteria bacterium]|nr:hypothetical protein [Actinomycetota bacterium]